MQPSDYQFTSLAEICTPLHSAATVDALLRYSSPSGALLVNICLIIDTTSKDQKK